jgi:hypothetical protein
VDPDGRTLPCGCLEGCVSRCGRCFGVEHAVQGLYCLAGGAVSLCQRLAAAKVVLPGGRPAAGSIPCNAVTNRARSVAAWRRSAMRSMVAFSPSSHGAMDRLDGKVSPLRKLRGDQAATRETSTSTSSACILRAHTSISSALDASGDAQQVFLAIERVVIRSWPGWDRPADGPIAFEGGLEDAFAARQRRQLLPQLVDASRGDVALERARRAPHRRRLCDGAQLCQHGQYGPTLSAGISRWKRWIGS